MGKQKETAATIDVVKPCVKSINKLDKAHRAELKRFNDIVSTLCEHNINLPEQSLFDILSGLSDPSCNHKGNDLKHCCIISCPLSTE